MYLYCLDRIKLQPNQQLTKRHWKAGMYSPKMFISINTPQFLCKTNCLSVVLSQNWFELELDRSVAKKVWRGGLSLTKKQIGFSRRRMRFSLFVEVLLRDTMPFQRGLASSLTKLEYQSFSETYRAILHCSHQYKKIDEESFDTQSVENHVKYIGKETLTRMERVLKS